MKSSKSFAIVDIMSSLPPVHQERLDACFVSPPLYPPFIFFFFSVSTHISSLTDCSNSPYPPDDVEDGWYEELIVDGHGHVAWLVESRGYGADGIAEVHTPQQEQELRWQPKGKTT